MLWDVIQTHEKGRPRQHPECIAVNQPLWDALLIAKRARIGWDDADFRIVVAPLVFYASQKK